MANTLFAFDLGTNSIGWSVLGLDTNGNPDRIIDAGVRIFSDGREPKSGTSLAEGRRVARGMSRRRDRYKRRRKAVLRVLTEYGLMPDNLEARRALVAETGDGKGDVPTDVYALRARALDEKLPLHHIGRTLFHLNQRRGFKSNRKTDRRDNEQGKIATAISALETEMGAAGARTLGEHLFKRRGVDPKNRGGVRVRMQAQATDGDKIVAGYGFYPQRKMLEDEFNGIWTAQAAHYPDVLTGERRAHLFRVIFFQRPLKRPKPGKCSFNSSEERLPKAHPLFQRFRLYKEVNELAIVLPDLTSHPLTIEQRDALIDHLEGQREAAYKSLRKSLNLPQGARFNKESESRTKMKGDEVAAEMAHKSRFGQGWCGKTIAEQWAVIGKLRETEDPLELHAWIEETFGFPPAQRDAIAEARLPDGYGRLGVTALTALLDELRADVIAEAEAAKRAGYDHALARIGDGMDELPKYQDVLERRIPPGSGAPDDPYDIRMGRITNPTVHIALNQLRRVINALIRRYGKPGQIAVELARDLKSSDREKDAVNRRIARNTREAERRSAQLRELGVQDTGYNRALLKFWEELDPAQPLDRVCVYSGEPISLQMLFSGEVDIDHILPWSKTLDDSQANRILCLTRFNRQKGNRAPFDVPEWQDRYDEIVERASKLPPYKRWRFARNAMERYEGERDFLARQLTDTQYLSRLAHEYLAALYPGEWGVFKRRNHVRVVPGRLTEMMRRAWGLNSAVSGHDAKNRNDHRHHVIDAIVAGVTTRGLLNRISHEAGRGVDVGAEDALRRFDPPWPSFRDDVRTAVDRIVVSHKPDHGTLPAPGKPGGTAGQLHNETAYGLTGEADEKGNPIVVRRKPFLSLTHKDLPFIRDTRLSDELFSAMRGLTGKELIEALRDFRRRNGPFHGVRRVRVTEPLNVIPIRDGKGVPYKGYKGDANFRYDVWELPDGRWISEVVSMFDAHRMDWISAMHKDNPAARKVLSLRQNDLVAYIHPGTGHTIGRVVKFNRSGQIACAAHNEGGALKSRDADKDDPFKYFYKSAGAMKAVQLRQIRVDEIGTVFDPGPRDRQSRAARAKSDGSR